MKLKIRFPGLLLPFRKQINYRNIVKKAVDDKSLNYYAVGLFVLWLLIMILCAFKADAQSQNGIRIGQKVPDMAPEYILNYKSPTAKISDFKGKLVILDFWNTWCGSCIAMIPQMELLQHQFKDKVQFLPVTNQPEGLIKPFLKKWELNHHEVYDLPDIVDDKILQSLFPHQSVPHYVWIDQNGTVKAISSSFGITADNITAMLNGNEISTAEKVDIDINKPLFAGPNFPENNLMDYTVFFHGRIEGTGSGSHPRRNKYTTGIAWTNFDLLHMYTLYGNRVLADFDAKKIILAVRDSSEFFPPVAKSSRMKWYYDNAYSIDVILPLKDSSELDNRLISALNQYTPYNAKVEGRKIWCLQLVRTVKPDQLASRFDDYDNRLSDTAARTARHIPVSQLVAFLNDWKKQWPLITNHTEFSGYLDITLKQQSNNIDDLRAELNRQGLDLVEADEEIDLLVVSDKLHMVSLNTHNSE
jgi:thiol-disulfide isomerase/thioredoxin